MRKACLSVRGCHQISWKQQPKKRRNCSNREIPRNEAATVSVCVRLYSKDPGPQPCFNVAKQSFCTVVTSSHDAVSPGLLGDFFRQRPLLRLSLASRGRQLGCGREKLPRMPHPRQQWLLQGSSGSLEGLAAVRRF